MAEIKGGTKLAAKLAQIASGLSKPADLAVGFLAGATYPDKNGTPVAMVAAIQNFGAPSRNIPPRPFFTNMVADKSPGWPDAIVANLKATGYDAERTMKLVGEGIKGQLQQSIRDTNSPPLAESTIRKKGFSKPLIETSQLIDSVDYEVTT